MITSYKALKNALILTFALFFGASQTAQGAEEENFHALTPARIAALPPAERAAWQAYFNRSEAHLRQDKARLAAEVKAKNRAAPIPAPNGQGLRAARNAPASWFAGEEARKLADAAISFQTPSGGWSKGVAFDQGLRAQGMHWTTVVSDEWYYVGTFDNGANSAPMTALPKFYEATKDPKYAAAFLKGLDYIFDAQFPNGGWPQNYPLVGWYHDEVTFNDDAMTSIVGLMRDVATAKPEYGFVDEARRSKSRTAMEAGLRCILRAQIVQNGRLTAWCAQHDPLTLQAAPARRFEVASLSGGESAGVVRFLMSIEPPTTEIKSAVQSAIAWFESSKITGFDFLTRKNAVGGNAFYLEPNPNAEPLWARFYELGTNRPIFVNREAKVSYNLSELDQSGPGSGYRWYVNTPQKVLENYPRWRDKWAPELKPISTASEIGAGKAPATGLTPRVLSRPTYVLAGDSTVTDNAGWGLGFKNLLKPEATLVNLSKGGRSSGSFRKEGSWQKALDLKPQYVLIQFGHNDEPGHGAERETDPATTYKANLERYVDEARATGITPILVTPLSRRQWSADGQIKSSLAPYAEAVRTVAREKLAPLIDLHARSIAFYEAQGREKINAFSPPKEGGKLDGTHLNAAGSAAIAPLVMDELKKAIPALSGQFAG